MGIQLQADRELIVFSARLDRSPLDNIDSVMNEVGAFRPVCGGLLRPAAHRGILRANQRMEKKQGQSDGDSDRSTDERLHPSADGHVRRHAAGYTDSKI